MKEALFMKKYKLLTAVLDIGFKILAIGMAFLSILVVIFTFINKINLGKIEDFNMLNESFAVISFVSTIDNGKDYSVSMKIIYLIVMLMSALLLVAIFWLTSKIFQDLKRDFKPFKMLQVKRLHKIAVLVLSYAIAPQIMLSLLKKNFLPGYSFEFGIDMTLFLSFIFFCLTEVMRHGVELQIESDETL